MSLLSVKNVGKAFCSYSSEWKRFARWFGVPTKPNEEHWVLRHINFEIQAGEAVGIVGQNGAGKSTLLKMITGTLQPTEGNIQVNGRIAAILELGMGFNSELTGRQNVLHAAGLMGFDLDQIQQAMPDIEAFAEIGEYFDHPVRIYSSGMQMRVAFSVVTAFRPEILIVDEALAVGDAYFQRKCFQRLEDYKLSGGTLLFVSHDVNTVKTLCDRAVLIEGGRLAGNGSPKEIVDLYQAQLAKKNELSGREVKYKLSKPTASPSTGESLKIRTTVSNGDASLLDFRMENELGNFVRVIESESVLKIRYKIRLNKKFDKPAFGLIVRDRVGRSIFETSTYAMGMNVKSMEESVVIVEFLFEFNLKAGFYSFSVGVGNRGFSRSEFEESSLLVHDQEQIEVVEAKDSIYFGGIFNMAPKVSIEQIQSGL